MNIQMAKRYTPFAELGFDLGDAILGSIFDSDEEEGMCCDAYFSVGFKAVVNERLSAGAYWKIYDHVYDSLKANSARKTFNTHSLGLNLLLRY
jgi:hypothetical protein